jgi:hypothetical protein
MLIDLFIGAGWHTVPLKGELTRLESGKKTIPVFEENWRNKYTKKFNETSVKLAGAITGACSNIIAIDCDNQFTYDLFKRFDPDYDFHFISKGKPDGGGTIIYSYNSDVGSFKLNTDEIALDFFSDEGFVYLPTEANQTKESWQGVEKLPEIKEVPFEVLVLLKTFKSKVPAVGVNQTKPRTVISNRLAPMVENFVKRKKYEPTLFKVLTPYSFRDLPSYIAKGHLHPNDVPQGRGSEYLNKVSAILGADISISKELYTNTMMLINSFWDDPMEKSKLNKTILEPMIEERATVDGDVIWKYDEHWEQMGFIATSLNGDYLESFYDDVKGLYYLINYTVPYVKVYGDKRPVITTLKTLLGRTITEVQYDSTKQLIRTSLNPALEFGHMEGGDMFNLFRQTAELNVLNNPAPYSTQYNRPKHILKYFETLIPDDFMRGYVLSFLKTKLTTFKYSPVILYMIGKPGSGKDTMVNILGKIIGADYIAKPDTKVFLEQYNGWMLDKYIIQLDEYGNKLNKSSEKQEALGKLKAYTGSSEMQIRAMRQDGFNYKHSITFVMTANSNPLPVETDDRRVCFIRTPNRLDKQEWVVEAGGISHVHDTIMTEIMDFCYYLATEVNVLKSDDYVIAPETEDKEKLILESLPAAEQIIYYIQHSKYKELEELAAEYGVRDFNETWEKNRLQGRALEELYDAMTEGNGTNRTIIKMMKAIGLSRSHTTAGGQNVFYWFIQDLHLYTDRKRNEDTENDGFVKIDTSTVVPKGLR